MIISFLLFDGVTQLDFTGPAQFLARLPDSEIVTASKTGAAITTDSGFSILPSHKFGAAPAADVLCIPGGFGTAAAMQDPDTLAFVRRQAEGAQYVTSVCTGAFILGAAGLLKGKRATTHWAYHDMLSGFGAIPVAERVVTDGTLITGGGVTAGIDFALTLTAKIAGQSYADGLRLALEYDPAPSKVGGHPSTAAPETLDRVKGFYSDSRARIADAIKTLSG